MPRREMRSKISKSKSKSKRIKEKGGREKDKEKRKKKKRKSLVNIAGLVGVREEGVAGYRAASCARLCAGARRSRQYAVVHTSRAGARTDKLGKPDQKYDVIYMVIHRNPVI